jgi:hypothetical protein
VSNPFFERPIRNSPYAQPDINTAPEHFVGVNKMVKPSYASRLIRPLAVRPLTHPERMPNPWSYPLAARVLSEGRQHPHRTPDLYSEARFAVHIMCDAHRKTCFSIHVAGNMYRKAGFPIHVSPCSGCSS